MTNKIISLFLDASVWGGYYDDEFLKDTRLLFQNIKDGKYTVFISDLVKEELENAPEKVRHLLNEIKYQMIEVTAEHEKLADEYIREEVIGETSRYDCIHIAAATIYNVDFLVSWNFKHIVNVKRIRGYNAVNIKNGYKCLEIRSPKDMGVYDE
jgi:hypothetical protein